MYSIFKRILREIFINFVVKYAPTIFFSLLGGCLATTALFNNFGDTLLAASIEKITPSWVEISYKNDKIKEVLKELQESCGRECYASQLYIKKFDIGIVAYFNSVMGYSEKLGKVIDIKSFMDSNSIYYQKHIFSNEENMGLKLLGSNTKCRWINKDQLKEGKFVEITDLLDSLHVDIENMTICLENDVQTIILLTWKLKNDCGKCLDNVDDAGKNIQRILQSKII